MSSKHFLPLHRKLLIHENNRQFEKYPRSEENLRSKLDPLRFALRSRGCGCGNSFPPIVIFGTSLRVWLLCAAVISSKAEEESLSLSWEMEQKQAYAVAHISQGQRGRTPRLPPCPRFCESVFPLESHFLLCPHNTVSLYLSHHLSL